MSKNLIIVESPAKAKTIQKYLGKEYTVEATIGHIKNLPKNKINIDIENGYKPNYEIIPGKETVIKRIKQAASKAEKVFIATDPDREGEAIANDIAEEIKPVNNSIKRVLFTEITKSGVESAMKEPKDIDENLVTSQVARRVMDRILGYKLSPFLWKSFYYGLSAGRVQSVALKLICEREEEIRKFVPTEYWSIWGIFSKLSGNTKPFNAKLYQINNEVIKYNGEEPRIKNIEEAHKILEELRNNKFKVIDIQVKDVKRNPPAPFTTSVLQQVASTKLGFSPKKTMSLAQKLYEGVEIRKGEGNIGLITYMRTDSTRISSVAAEAARSYIERVYGNEFLPTQRRIAKQSKNAQDAHEAIRPTDVNITPEQLKGIDKNLIKLYTLIWQRFIASQMNPAIYEQKTIFIKALNPKGAIREYIFKGTGSIVKYAGYLKVYEEEPEEDSKEDEEEFAIIPPDLKIDDMLNALNLNKQQHFTSPPPRYTESSLIKQLDSLGIGRPSTFAQIVSTVIDRKYVDLKERRLYATELGMIVNRVLNKYFPDIINTKFTAEMEEELDTIASGTVTYKKVLDDFYIPFKKDLEKAESETSVIKNSLVEKTDIKCPECGDETGAVMLKKWGRNGQFYTCERYPKCKATMSVVTEEHQHNEVSNTNGEIPKCDLCGADMVLRIGRYGKFYGCTNYPKCKGVKPFTLGITCPKCGKGEIVQRKAGKTKRNFYGCSRYPECDFLENSLPVLEPCEKCGNNYLLLKENKNEGKFLVCPKCEAKYPYTVESEKV